MLSASQTTGSELVLWSIPASRAVCKELSHLADGKTSPQWWHTTQEPMQTTRAPTVQTALNEGGETLD